MLKNVENRFITVPQLAARWSVSLPHAYRVAGSILPALRVGGSVRVPLDAVLEFERGQLGRIPGEASCA